MIIGIFKDLWTSHTTWASLETYLTSCEGGSLRIIKCDDRYSIIRYDKLVSQFSVPHVPYFRSVVWDTLLNRPVCVAPLKAMEGFPEEGAFRCEEFLEGVMINAFLDSSGSVLLATRSKLGASGTYYSSRSFQDLLQDALVSKNVVLTDLFTGSTTFVSLLLQHPEHRIVAKIEKPNVYIIHQGLVDLSGNVILQNQGSVSPLSFPEPIDAADLTKNTCAAFVQGLAEKKGWMWQGLVIKDSSGQRYRVRSNAYSMIRTLRGDSPRSEVRFLKLRSKQLLETYLYYYTDEKDVMWRLEQRLRGLTQQLYQAYVAAHITHTCTFVELPPHLKTHVYSLHSMYLGTLKAKGFFVRKQEVIEYVNRLPIPRILHLLKTAA